MQVPTFSSFQAPARRIQALRNLYWTFLILLLLAYAGAIWQSWNETLRDARASLTHINSMLVQATRSTLNSHELILRGLGGEMVANGALEQPERGRNLIERMKAIDPGMVGFGLARTDGQLILVSGIPPGRALPNLLQQPATAESFRKAIESDRIQIGRPYFMKPLSKWAVPIRVPIRDLHGQLKAVMTAGYSLDGGTTAWARMQLPDKVSVALLRDDQYLQYVNPLPQGDSAQSREKFYGQPIAPKTSQQLAAMGGDRGFGLFFLERLNRSDYVVFERLHEQGLTAATLFPRAEVIRLWLDHSLAPTVLFILFVISSTWGYRRTISRLVESDAELLQGAQALQESNNSLQLINQLSNTLHRCLEVRTIARETLDTLTTHIKPPMGVFYLLGADRQHLEMIASHGLLANQIEACGRIPMPNNLSSAALREGRALIIQGDPFGPSAKVDLLEPPASGTGIILPLTYSGEPFGCIRLLHESEHIWREAEINTLLALARTVSLAIANARHVDDLEFQTRHDPLTGLANRLALHERFKEMAATPEQKSIALLLIDLDHFKEINDTLGHHIGDLLLREIGPRLNSAIGTRSHLLTRLGGDEFGLLFDGIDNAEAAQRLAQDLRDAIKFPYHVEGISLEIGASIGIALYPEHGEDSHRLLRAADVAMYEAKRSGAGALLYQRSLDKHSPERLALMVELGPAIQNGQLVLHYQPKYDLIERRVTGFEALVRWNHPTRGLLYPDRFIPMAETSESIHPLTHNVLCLALQQQRAWKAAGQRFSIAVNLSARNLIDGRCVEFLTQLLDEYQVEPGDLELEITESALMYDPEGAIDLLHRIAEQGVSLSIDDFGTGFSSLAYLRRMPIKALKIDRVFVKEMLGNPQDAIIVHSTIGLAHNLGIKVIAEGVEDAATLEALASIGCDMVQGYFVSKPKPWLELADWVDGYRVG